MGSIVDDNVYIWLRYDWFNFFFFEDEVFDVCKSLLFC